MDNQMNAFGISTSLFKGSNPLSIETAQECLYYQVKYLEIAAYHTTGEYDEIFKAIYGKYSELKFWSIHLPFGGSMDISCLDEEERKEILDTMRKIIERYLVYDIKKVVIHPGGNTFEPHERGARLGKSAQSIDYLTKVCKARGVSLVVECLPRQCLGNCIEEMEFLLGNKETEMCYDTNHITLNKPIDIIKALSKRITTCHLADFDGIDEKHWEPYKGVLPFDEIIKKLTYLKYRGPLMFEVGNKEGKYAASVESLAKCYERLI